MGKAFSDQEKEQVKERIIKVAYDLFESHPFRSVKMEDIAKTVGIGKGTLYLFYPSKEHLFVSVMMAFENNLQRRMMLSLQTLETPKEKLMCAMIMGLEETEQNEIYRALMDAELITKIIGAVGADEAEKMAEVDLAFMDMLLGGLPIKVSRELAVDLLRGIFFLRLFESQLLTPKAQFYEVYLKAVIDQIL